MTGLFDKNTIDAIKDRMLLRKDTLALAESVTSGLLQLAIGSADDASLFFQGGITVYNIGQKCRHLLVEPIHAMSCNCVSAKVAEEMALNVCTLFNSDWGIGITGYSSPVPESDNKLFCHYAIAFGHKIVFGERISAKNAAPLDVQVFYTQHLLNAFADCVARQ